MLTKKHKNAGQSWDANDLQALDTPWSNLLRTTIFGEGLIQKRGDANILPCLLKAFKEHCPDLYDQRNALSTPSQVIATVSQETKEYDEVQPGIEEDWAYTNLWRMNRARDNTSMSWGVIRATDRVWICSGQGQRFHFRLKTSIFWRRKKRRWKAHIYDSHRPTQKPMANSEKLKTQNYYSRL